MDNNQLLAVSRFFSAGVIREMANKGASPTLARLAREARIVTSDFDNQLVRDLFDFSYKLLKAKNYRHEYIYKAALTEKILLGTHSLQTASMLTEFRVGACKADVAILNGTATVYEIKTERDSLSRLERQINAYKSVFAKVYVIAGEKHISSIEKIVSNDVGLLKLSNKYTISTIRDAINMPERTSALAIFDSIRINESKKILDLLDIEVPELPNTEIYGALRELFKSLDPTEVHMNMVKVLKKTRSLRPLSEFIGDLPVGLQTAAITAQLKKSGRERLKHAIDTPLQVALEWI